MKKIGFIDYYLSEWHADKYPAWIEEVCREREIDCRVAYGWAELDVSPRDGVTTDEWCSKFGVERCSSIAEVCEKSDYIVVLSPDNAEHHLRYSLEVIPYGKPVYVDKTFTLLLDEAKEIFTAAKEHGTPLCSASALRFAEEIKDFRTGALSMTTYGSGSAYEIYAVHQIEMIVKCMGCNPVRVMALQNTLNKSLLIEFEGGRRAMFNHSIKSGAPFAVSVETGEGEKAFFSTIKSDFFRAFIREMMSFFVDGTLMVPEEDTIAVVAIIDAGARALKNPGEWVEV